MTVVWDDETSTPIAYFGDGSGIVSYDDERSICLKTEYAIDERLNGFVSSPPPSDLRRFPPWHIICVHEHECDRRGGYSHASRPFRFLFLFYRLAFFLSSILRLPRSSGSSPGTSWGTSARRSSTASTGNLPWRGPIAPASRAGGDRRRARSRPAK